MKVLMTTDAVGGVWTYAIELCTELARHDVDVVLAVMGPPASGAQCESAAQIRGLRLYSSQLRLEWMSDPWRDVERAGEWLQELAQREAVDLIHLNGFSHAALPWRKPVVVVAHSCVCSWWQAVHGQSPPSEWDVYRRNVAAGVRSADHVVAPTFAFLAEIKRWHASAAATSVIYNARSPTLFAHDANNQREPLILASGRLWDEAKNMRALDAVARDLPWPTYVAGDARAPDGPQFSAASLQCLGALCPDEIASWLKRAAIYVHPAKYEPFGLSVLEAALAGCALVLADLPSLRELWDGAALFVPVGHADDSANALHPALQRLIAEPALRQQLSQAALLRARQFTPGRMGCEYFSLYAALLAHGRTQEPSDFNTSTRRKGDCARRPGLSISRSSASLG
ncbi:MAG: glycosyltransferase family 4 protein [Steroidobacter sp.]